MPREFLLPMAGQRHVYRPRYYWFEGARRWQQKAIFSARQCGAEQRLAQANVLDAGSRRRQGGSHGGVWLGADESVVLAHMAGRSDCLGTHGWLQECSACWMQQDQNSKISSKS